jgi:hypothetical protein
MKESELKNFRIARIGEFTVSHFPSSNQQWKKLRPRWRGRTNPPAQKRGVSQ